MPTKNPPGVPAGGSDCSKGKQWRAGARGLFLPSALLVTIGFEALAALVLRHLEAAFLLEISHARNVRLRLRRVQPDFYRESAVLTACTARVKTNTALTAARSNPASRPAAARYNAIWPWCLATALCKPASSIRSVLKS